MYTYEGQYVGDIEGRGAVQTGSIFSSKQRQLHGQLVHNRIHGCKEIFGDQHEKHTLKRLNTVLGLLNSA